MGQTTKGHNVQLKVTTTRYITVNKEAQQRLEKAASEQLCCACMKPRGDGRIIRGNHERCYRATMRYIERGIWTEAERISEGKLLPADEGGRPLSNPVSVEASHKHS